MSGRSDWTTYKKRGAAVLLPVVLVFGILGLRSCLRYARLDHRSASASLAADARLAAAKHIEEQRDEARAEQRRREMPNAVPGAHQAVVARGQGLPNSVVVDEARIYWINTESGEVMAMGRGADAGGGPTALATPGALPAARHAQALAVDREAVYWIGPVTRDAGDSDDRKGGSMVLRVAKTGGTPTVVMSWPGPLTGLLVHGGSVYTGTDTAGVDAGARSGTDSDDARGAILRAPVRGGKPVAVARANRPCALAADDKNVYFVDSARQSSIVRVPKSGGVSDTILSSGGRLGCSLVVDATSVYWPVPSDDAVMVAAKDGTDPRLLATTRARPSALAIRGDTLYVLTESLPHALEESGTIFAVPRVGGAAPTALATDEVGLNGLAVSGDELFWTKWTEGDHEGTVVRAQVTSGVGAHATGPSSAASAR